MDNIRSNVISDCLNVENYSIKDIVKLFFDKYFFYGIKDNGCFPPLNQIVIESKIVKWDIFLLIAEELETKSEMHVTFNDKINMKVYPSKTIIKLEKNTLEFIKRNNITDLKNLSPSELTLFRLQAMK